MRFESSGDAFSSPFSTNQDLNNYWEEIESEGIEMEKIIVQIEME